MRTRALIMAQMGGDGVQIHGKVRNHVHAHKEVRDVEVHKWAGDDEHRHHEVGRHACAVEVEVGDEHGAIGEGEMHGLIGWSNMQDAT